VQAVRQVSVSLQTSEDQGGTSGLPKGCCDLQQDGA